MNSFSAFPAAIASQLRGLPYTEDAIGKSGSRVLMFPEAVLKIERDAGQEDSTVAVMRWLEGRLPAPRVLAYEKEGGLSFLLMTSVPGQMACHPDYLARPDVLLPLLAEAMHMLWRTDLAGCPRDRSIDMALREARSRVEAGLVDIENAEPDTFGPHGFASPEALLHWLEDNRPAPEPTLSHGDFCLPNIFFQGRRVSGFIDLGDTGISDQWRDIALCCRSLMHNTDGTFGRKYPGYSTEKLLTHLGVAPDWDKLRYYTLLDELF